MRSGAKLRTIRRILAVTALSAIISACGAGDQRVGGNDPLGARAVADYPVKIGEPYQLDGQTYVPQDVMNFDEVGYASWYGAEFGGRPTANGEAFMPQGISAAHRTLPLPSYVEVTSLDTGRTILVRINDRGPASSKRLIDLSYGAAQQLGMVDQGVGAVRVRRVNPPEQERLALREGNAAAMRLETPESLLVVLRRRLDKGPAPAPIAGRLSPSQYAAGVANGQNTPIYGADAAQPGTSGYRPSAPRAAGNNGRFTVENSKGEAGAGSAVRSVPLSNSFVVQVAAFESKSRADALANKIGARVTRSSDGSIWRVRYGPYPSRDAAQDGINRAQKNGYNEAVVFNDGAN